MILIGIMGAKRAGKDTTAKTLLNEFGYIRRSMAGPLKSMLHAIGLTFQHTDGFLKETPCELLCGETPRKAMITLGTEWRNLIHPHLWTKMMEHQIGEVWYEKPQQPIVITDIRFPHEVDMVRRAGGEIWLVRNPRVEPGFSLLDRFKRWIKGEAIHASELHWRTTTPDVTLDNSTTPEELAAQVRAEAQRLVKQRRAA